MELGDDRLPERFWAKIEVNDECWIWRGALTAAGYGSAWIDGKTQYPHRLTFALSGGVVGPGEEVDHSCHQRPCCQPRHLRAASRAQNQRNRAGAQRNGSSGVRGVSWHSQRGKWVAQAHAYGKHYHGGLFDSIEDAAAAAEKLRAEIHR